MSITQPNILELIKDAPVEWKPLGDITLVKTGQSINKNIIANNPGKYPVINSGREPLGFVDKWNTDNDPIGITTRGAGVGSVTWQEGKYFRGNLNYSVTINNNDEIMVRFLFHLLELLQPEIHALCTFDGIPALNASVLKTLSIPIPPPAIQQKIVRILDTMTAVTSELTSELSNREKQYNYYRDQLLSFDENEVEWKTLGEAVELIRGKRLVKSQLNDFDSFPVFQNSLKPLGFYDESNAPAETTFIVCAGAAGEIGYQRNKFWAADDVHYLLPKEEQLISRYIFHFLVAKQHLLSSQVRRASIPRLSRQSIERIKIPIPSLEEQARIVAILDKFDTLTNSISEGLPREIELRQKQYEYYRNLLLTFPKPEQTEVA